MKEFILKHPIISFLLADSIITGVFNTVKYVSACFAKNNVVEVMEGEKHDEPANDIQ